MAASKRRPNRWLVKTEPGDYSFDDLEEDGGTVWDGVGNNLALIHMRRVREGDRALVYHTGRERQVVGIARVTSDPYPDPAGDDERRVVFDLEAERRFASPVPLAGIKKIPRLADWELVTNPRLSVMPVPAEAWRRVLALAGDD